MTDNAPILHRGIGTPTKCRSCKASIVFAVMYVSGKRAPFQLDDQGEYVLENGTAKHIGKPPVQPDLFATDKPQRYTAHFAVCPNAADWRK